MKTMTLEADNLLTLAEVCSLLKVPKTWIYRQTREGDIPHHKLGKYLRFYRPELEKWFINKQVNR